MEASANKAASGKPAVDAIFTGLVIAALSFISATAQGMVTAPSATIAILATGGIVLGLALTIMGIASVWIARFRRPARTGNYVALSALVLAFLADKALAVLA